MARSDERRERVVLTFSVLPQEALSTAREPIDGAEMVLRRLEDWALHLERARRTVRWLGAAGWRVTLLDDTVSAEHAVTAAELAALARELKNDLAALTAVAEPSEGGSAYRFEGDAIARAEPDEPRPLV
jgi:hypothetical protein